MFGRSVTRVCSLRLAAFALCALSLPAIASATAVSQRSWTYGFNAIQTLGSTVPKNGDVNPYGIAVVPTSRGRLQAGDVLVSNFNAKSNSQGTGTTIVEITPKGQNILFAKVPATGLPGPCPGGSGSRLPWSR
jgi:hypothetical protein